MEYCAIRNNTNCPDQITLDYASDIYCCNYVLGNPEELSDQLSQQGLHDAITLVRDLNIASLVSDYVFVALAGCTFFGLYIVNGGEFKNAKQITLVLTALGSLIDVVITFTIVGIIDQNNLVNGMTDLYNNNCYLESLDRTILELENQFQTVLILDVVEGLLDISSLFILFCGYFYCSDNKESDDAAMTCSEGIHTFMFAVFDIVIVSLNVYLFVLPSYKLFDESYNDESLLCFMSVDKPSISKSVEEISSMSSDEDDWMGALNYVVIGFIAVAGCCLLIIGTVTACTKCR